MKRIILDTNIYGLVAVDEKREEIRRSITSSGIVLYGSTVIRKELRKTKKGIVDGVNLRNVLLSLYHEMTKDKELDLRDKHLKTAESYFSAYRELGGTASKSKLLNDFLIVASASLHNLDIVVSEDNATMLNELALKAYSVVNAALKIDIPGFIGYEQFKKELKK